MSDDIPVFRLLGPVEVGAGDTTVQFGRPQQRDLLALLALNLNQLTTVDQVLEGMWHGAVPASGAAQVQNMASALRAALRTAGLPATLDRQRSGYVLRAEPAQSDLVRFDALLRRAAATPSADERAGLLGDAVVLWRGEPLGNVRAPFADPARLALQERYDGAVEALLAAQVAAGRHGDALPELIRLVRAQPNREGLVGQLMLALHRAGRRVEALEVYRAAAQRIADDYGLEPGADLRELHVRLLRDDPALQLPPSSPSPSSPHSSSPSPPPSSPPDTTVGPAELPRAAAGFVGREAQLSWLDGLLPGPDDTMGPPVIAAVTGTAGVGKTALVVHWAHRVADRFPDGQLYVDLRGFDTNGPMAPRQAIRGFLDALDVPPARIPLSLEAQIGLYRSLLAGRKLLVVLDNARDARQVRPLLPGSPGCVAAVTSRDRLASLVAIEGAQPIGLDVLTITDARQLLAGRLGAQRVAAEPQATDEIITRCARLPLALAVVAARAANHPEFPLEGLAEELGDARGSLDAFDGMDSSGDLRAVFSRSYDILSSQAASLFRLLGLHAGPDITLAAAASLKGVSVKRVRPLLFELTAAHLIDERVPRRYAIHDLLRSYSNELAHLWESDTDRNAALHRVFDHYLHTAHGAAVPWEPYRDPMILAAAQPGVTSEEFADGEHVLAWYTAERAVLLRTVEEASRTGFDAHTWQLASAIGGFLELQGHWHEWIGTHSSALDAARRLADRPGQASAHRGLGRAYTLLGLYDEATRHHRHALELSNELGDVTGQAATYFSLTLVSIQVDRYEEALEHATRALGQFRAAGHRYGEARALNAVGWCHANLNNHRQALTHCRQALTVFREIGDRPGEALALDSLGYAYHGLGQHRKATSCYQRALDIVPETGNRLLEATVLAHIGDNHYAAGQASTAHDSWQQALIILDQLDRPEADQVRDRLNGGIGDRNLTSVTASSG